ncbi:helix-turn-helix domain-containing protein [Cellulophaga sp. E16_2]|uniref:helix-turn-helix domain-containing protein n=1 Tax=Cellulophaga sp. E16_2 TaxID=2789297 RepID=UPI001A93A1F4|nr:helix-turn-helix domain-containing protein [Cellulophaga sp. E16_2]MBO0592202.1 helix-turn-helix domain-containing protein [Cellulophaga sp. E16_2]
MFKSISFFTLFLIVTFFNCSLFLNAQTTFVLDDVAPSGIDEPTYYLSGSFNEWEPGNTRYKFEKKQDGKYYTKPLVFEDATIMFLVTRGSWETVEVEGDGLPVLTRKISFAQPIDSLHLKISGWADIEGRAISAKKITVKVTEIPKSTPPDAPIYIAGNFNGWVPGDKRYKLLKADDGSYHIDVPLYYPRLAYKFTRGNWYTVEGKAYGRPRNDRFKLISNETLNEPLIEQISYWEDQSSGLFNPYTLILILAGIQGIFLIFIINSYDNNNRIANRVLSVLLLLLAIILLTRVSLYDRDIYNSYPRLSLFQDLVYFLYAPIFFIYIKKLLKIPSNPKAPNHWWYFVPFMVQVIVYLLFFFEPLHQFIDRAVSRFYPSEIYITIGGIALLFNIWFWFKIRQVIKNYLKNIENTYSYDQDINYLNTIMLLKGGCLLLWVLIFIVGGYGYIMTNSLSTLTLFLVDSIWILFSLTVFLLGYYAIKQPAIFKIHEVKEEIPKANTNDNGFLQLKEKLIQCMEIEKVFLDPALSLPELAQKLQTNVHLLSRTINDGFDKNFRDYVNEYRVTTFIEKVNKEGYRNHTFLGIALDVGFNSKSSFNRSFKKITGKTPREYFKA